MLECVEVVFERHGGCGRIAVVVECEIDRFD
jgi:hypothetical protein